MFAFKLHKKVVYRLALYQVLASLSFAAVSTLQAIFINFNDNPEAYGRVCTAVGWFVVFSFWTKLLFTMWVTFHLFCFAILHKNLKKLEVLYVMTSLLVPVVIAAVPLITNTYGLSPPSTACYIEGQYNASNNATSNRIATIQRFALVDGPAMVILIAASIAMVVMVIKLAHGLCWSLKYEPIADGAEYWTALKQLLPLSAFPILFIIFLIPQLVYDIYAANAPELNIAAEVSVVLSTSLWSMTSGVTLIVHISMMRYCTAKRRRKCTICKL